MRRYISQTPKQSLTHHPQPAYTHSSCTSNQFQPVPSIMQFSTAFFALASALLFVVPTSAATLQAEIACTPRTSDTNTSSQLFVEDLIWLLYATVAACNGNNNYDVGHSCKYYISACTGSYINGRKFFARLSLEVLMETIITPAALALPI